MIDWSGIFHVMATPFTDGGDLDNAGLPRLVESALATGISGITELGIAGEAHRLTDEERRRVVEGVVKEARGRVPVAVGVSASGTHLATSFTRMAQEHGADALMVAPPAGLRNLDAVADYYLAVADASRIPLVLQDEPVTTQVTMPAAFLARLCGEVPRIEAVKLEEAPTLPKITRLRELLADGAMTGFPYPEALKAIRDAFVAGRRDEARQLFYRWLPLIRYESQPGSTPGTAIGIRKEILRRRGWITSARVRPPATVLDEGTLAELTEIVRAVGG